MVTSVRSLLPSVVALFVVVSSASAQDIVDTAVSAGQFKTLVTAVQAADLVETLKGKGPFTVFAPTDAAFEKLPSGTVAALVKPENKKQLTSILTYHVTPGRVNAKDIFRLSCADTVNGQRLAIAREGSQLTVADARVITTDIQCDNGVIHVIDAVMLPSDKTIPEVAGEAGSFETLIAAVKAAGLADVLSSDGPFTVFAPTDEAFAKLPKGTVQSLLQPENKGRLVNILKYHVVPGRVYADQAVDAGRAKTLQGQPLAIQFGADGVKVNDSRVVATDVAAANGVIHVIDSVLLPTEINSQEARRRLEDAVKRGARLYNQGDMHACCQEYENVCRELVDTGTQMPSTVTSVLSASLKRAESIRHEGERAWVLRHGIDLAYFALNH